MFSEEMLVFFLIIVIFALSSVSTGDLKDFVVLDQLKQTLYATLLEELRGAHLRIAATNVSETNHINKLAKKDG